MARGQRQAKKSNCACCAVLSCSENSVRASNGRVVTTRIYHTHLCANGVQLVNEDDCRRLFLGQRKRIAYELGAITDKHLCSFERKGSKDAEAASEEREERGETGERGEVPIAHMFSLTTNLANRNIRSLTTKIAKPHIDTLSLGITQSVTCTY